MTCRLLLITGVILGMALPPVFAASIVGSKHDLGTGGYAATVLGRNWNTTGAVSDEVCVFCHTPHGSNNDLNNDAVDDGNNKAPLWNRRISDTGVYQVYTSPTMNASCAATPNPVSLACLSCHDGRTGSAQGDISAVTTTDTHANSLFNPSNRRDPAAAAYGVNCGGCHDDFINVPELDWRIGANLTDDHPVSIDYQVAQAADGGLNAAPDWTKGWSDIKLYNGRVECPSCHNVHDPSTAPFLRKTMDGSALCLTCHNK